MRFNIFSIKKGDIVFYRNGKTNTVKKPYNYQKYFSYNLNNIFDYNYDIVKVKRYYKILCFYRLKTIYKRKEI